MTNIRYKHTQVGWTILIAMAGTIAITAGLLIAAGANSLPAIIALVVLAVCSSFCALTVTVDDDELRARFGVGLFGKTIMAPKSWTGRSVRRFAL
jgi:hypothetical protein